MANFLVEGQKVRRLLLNYIQNICQKESGEKFTNSFFTEAFPGGVTVLCYIFLS